MLRSDRPCYQEWLADPVGAVIADGTAWGKQRFTSGTDDSANTLWGQNAEARGYVGQEHVAPISLINLNARMYDAWLGRFLAADPIIAFRPTVTDGVWEAFFMRFKVAKIDLRDKEPQSETVMDVSEHLSGMSPV